MTETVELPLWLFLLIVVFAMVTFASHFLFPSVRWFFRRRLERAVARLNQRLQYPIQPFKLARRHDMIQRLIYDPQVGQAVQAHAQEEGVPEAVAFEQARRYAREIVPSFSAFTYFSFAIRLVRMLSNAFYDVRLSYEDEGAVNGIDPDATVIFVMNHRSNMDYVLVTYLAADKSALSYAVGEWARVWPLSRLIRALGAYFIRRKSGSDLYRQVLACYVRHATEAGVTQAMFPEGGLSVTGGLREPRMGLLKYITDAARDSSKEVVFVPVALNYDRVLEDRILTEAAARGDRRFSASIGMVTEWTFRQIGLKLTGRYRKFGRASVRYGLPISLAEFQHTDHTDIPTELGEELMARIGAVVPLSAGPLACWLIKFRGPMPEAEAKAWIAAKAAETTGSDAQTIDEAIDALVEREILLRDGGDLRPPIERTALMDYYALSVAHRLSDADSAGANQPSATAGS